MGQSSISISSASGQISVNAVTDANWGFVINARQCQNETMGNPYACQPPYYPTLSVSVSSRVSPTGTSKSGSSCGFGCAQLALTATASQAGTYTETSNHTAIFSPGDYLSGSTQAQQAYCPTPASEVSSAASWCSSCIGGTFMANLQNTGGASPSYNQYTGRTITEAISSETDGCWFSGSRQLQVVDPPPPGPPWPVGAYNSYGADLIGMPVAWVRYYQGAISSGLAKYSGCTESDTQTMSIDTCGGPPAQYNSHFAAVSVTATSVSATRGTASVSGN